MTRAELRALLVAEAERQAERLARELGLPEDEDKPAALPRRKISETTRERVRQQLRRSGRM